MWNHIYIPIYIYKYIYIYIYSVFHVFISVCCLTFQICEEQKNSSCGSLLFSVLIPSPNLGHMRSHLASSFSNLPQSSQGNYGEYWCIGCYGDTLSSWGDTGNCIAATYHQYVLYQRSVSVCVLVCMCVCVCACTCICACICLVICETK